MAKALLLNMKDYTIVKEFPSMAEAEAAQDEFTGFPKHLVDREEWDLTAVDLVHFYNKLLPEGSIPVKRFSDRPTGMARLLRLMNGEVLPVVDETAVKEVRRKKRTGELHGTNVTVIETKEKSVKKKASKSTGGKPAARKNSVALDVVLKPTKAGQERRWHAEANRGKLFAYILKKGEVTVKEFLSYGENQLKMAGGAVLAALNKLTDANAAGGASVKTVGG